MRVHRVVLKRFLRASADSEGTYRSDSRIRCPPLESFDTESCSYDKKVVTKEWNIAEKKFSPAVGFEPGLPG